MYSKTHEVFTERPASQRASVRLKDLAVIPNKDFVLRYDVSGGKIEDAILTHRGNRGGFFTLILQPPEKTSVEDITPKELVFVLDTSGSMSGFPIEKAKETMKLALDATEPSRYVQPDHLCRRHAHPVSPTRTRDQLTILRAAQQFLASRSGAGGTEMMKAITAALAPVRKTHERSSGVLHDRRLCRQRNRDHSRDRRDFQRRACFPLASAVQ